MNESTNQSKGRDRKGKVELFHVPNWCINYVKVKDFMKIILCVKQTSIK